MVMSQKNSWDATLEDIEAVEMAIDWTTSFGMVLEKMKLA
jgi:hypothetical protein